MTRVADNYVEIKVKATDDAAPDMDALKARLAELGTKVETAQVDVNDKQAAAKLLDLNAKLAVLNQRAANPKVSLAGAARIEAQIAAIDASLDHLGDKNGGKSGDDFAKAFADSLRGLSGAVGGSGIGGDAGKKGEESGGFFSHSFTQTVLGGLKGTLITGLSAAFAALPAIGAVAGAGMVIGLGAMIADKIPAVAKQFKAFGAEAMGTLEKAVQPMIGPLLSALKQVGGFLKQIEPLLKQAFGAAGPLIEPLVKGLEGMVSGVLPGLVSLLKAAMPAVQALAGILGKLGAGLGQMFTAFAPAVKASSVVLSAIGSVLTGILPVVAQLAGSLAGVLAPVIKSVAGMFSGLAPVIGMIGKVIGEFAQAFLVNLAGGFQALIGLVRAIEPALGTLAGALGQVFNLMNNRGVFNDLEDAVEELVGPIGKLVDALVAGLVPILPPLISLATRLAGTLQGALVTAVQILVPVAISLVNSVLKPLLPIFQALTPVIAGVADILASGLGPTLRIIAPLLTTLGPAILAIIGAIKLWSIAQAALDLVMSANPLVLLGLAIVAVVGIIVEAIKHWQDFENVAKTVFKAVAGAVADAFDWVKAHWPLLLAILTGPIGVAVLLIIKYWKQISDGARTMLSDLTSFFKGLPHDILAAIGDLSTLLFDAGKKIIQGLINGIKSMVGDLSHAASSVVDEIKNFLPFSPAKKGPLSGSGAPDVSGARITANIAKGMLSGVGAVQEAAARIASAASVGTAGGGYGGSGGYGGYGGAGSGGQPQPLVFQFGSGGTGLSQQFMTWLKETVRVSGGDPAIFTRKVKFQ